MDVLSNGQHHSNPSSNTRKRKSTSPNHLDLIKRSRRAYTEEYNSDSIPSSDHYSSSPVATPPSIVNILSPPETTSKQDPDITSRFTPPVTYEKTIPCSITPPSDTRFCPLPELPWAESNDVWKLMCRKDDRASLERNPDMLTYHPELQPRMRAILLDWLIEVCDVYKLHRETYYLAVDYLDRFLSVKKESLKTPKIRLQLIGITCLFIAAKVEEIYPPKIAEFAYVTDGACEEEDIIFQEQLVLSVLKWKTSPFTIIGWLSIYMQLHASNRAPNILNRIYNREKGITFIYPQFSGYEFVQATQLLDLCTLDVGLSNFTYSILAAAAIAHTMGRSIAINVSGFDWDTLEPCYQWMQHYYDVICKSSEILLLEKEEQVNIATDFHCICPNINTDDSYIIQTHNISLNMLDKVIKLKEQREPSLEKTVNPETSQSTQTDVLTCPEGLLTPPASVRKSSESRVPCITHPKTPYQ